MVKKCGERLESCFHNSTGLSSRERSHILSREKENHRLKSTLGKRVCSREGKIWFKDFGTKLDLKWSKRFHCMMLHRCCIWSTNIIQEIEITFASIGIWSAGSKNLSYASMLHPSDLMNPGKNLIFLIQNSWKVGKAAPIAETRKFWKSLALLHTIFQNYALVKTFKAKTILQQETTSRNRSSMLFCWPRSFLPKCFVVDFSFCFFWVGSSAKDRWRGRIAAHKHATHQRLEAKSADFNVGISTLQGTIKYPTWIKGKSSTQKYPLQGIC